MATAGKHYFVDRRTMNVSEARPGRRYRVYGQRGGKEVDAIVCVETFDPGPDPRDMLSGHVWFTVVSGSLGYGPVEADYSILPID